MCSEALGLERTSVPLGAPVGGTLTVHKNMRTLLCPGDPTFCPTTAQCLLCARPCSVHVTNPDPFMLHHRDVMKVVVTA